MNEKFPHTICYEELKKRAEAGEYGDVCLGGPMDVKTACDADSGSIKGITSPVVGNADVLIFPNIESGNVFYKTITLFAKAETAGILCGTTVPLLLLHVPTRASQNITVWLLPAQAYLADAPSGQKHFHVSVAASGSHAIDSCSLTYHLYNLS